MIHQIKGLASDHEFKIAKLKKKLIFRNGFWSKIGPSFRFLFIFGSPAVSWNLFSSEESSSSFSYNIKNGLKKVEHG